MYHWGEKKWNRNRPRKAQRKRKVQQQRSRYAMVVCRKPATMTANLPFFTEYGVLNAGYGSICQQIFRDLGQLFSAIHEVGLNELVLIGRFPGLKEVTIMFGLKRM